VGWPDRLRKQKEKSKELRNAQEKENHTLAEDPKETTGKEMLFFIGKHVENCPPDSGHVGRE